MTTNFETAVQQEVAYLQKVHPTPADIPTCAGTIDHYLRCHMLPSQMRSLYRYGQRAECARFLDEWKWCMSVNRLDPEAKREEWIRRRAEWWARRRLGRSSEDVWEYRTVPLENFPRPIDGHGVQILVSSPFE